MNIEEIKKATKEWSNARTSPEKVMAYFKQGTCFKIEKSYYEQWKKNSPKNFHVYMGIFGGSLKFVLIDSESDKDPAAHEDCIFVTDYLPGLNITEEGFIDKAFDGNIKVIDALKKIMRWNVFVESWVYNKEHTTYGIFQAFMVPFSDLIAQFEKTTTTESVVLFGLSANNQADLILWGLDSNEQQQSDIPGNPVNEAPVDDIACPVPPFGSEGFGLI